MGRAEAAGREASSPKFWCQTCFPQLNIGMRGQSLRPMSIPAIHSIEHERSELEGRERSPVAVTCVPCVPCTRVVQEGDDQTALLTLDLNQ